MLTFGRLLAADRAELVVELAQPGASAAEPDEAEVTAWMAARVRAGDEPYETLVADLRQAIASHPHEQGLYVLLGEVYEGGPDPRGEALARLCYQHVVDTARWHAVAGQARAGLERLGVESD